MQGLCLGAWFHLSDGERRRERKGVNDVGPEKESRDGSVTCCLVRDFSAVVGCHARKIERMLFGTASMGVVEDTCFCDVGRQGDVGLMQSSKR